MVLYTSRWRRATRTLKTEQEPREADVRVRRRKSDDRVKINFLTNNKSQIGSSINFIGEFDPGSGRTLAACLTHASRTETISVVLVANG